MIIYGSTVSPFVRKAVAFAHERGATVELKQLPLGSDDPDFLAASPLRKIPALCDGDFTLSDSTAIAFYIDAVTPGPSLIPSEAKARAMTVWWDEFADTELFGCLRHLFFNRLVSPLFLRRPGDEAAACAAEARMPGLFDFVEARMPDAGGFLVGDALTLADVAVASPYVNVRHLGIDLGPWPRLRAWTEAMHARPSFATMVAKETAMIARARAA